jgi:sterol desaturase/sphingolipid hydroxylase (fatty acid hydroxylase superfamily)
MYNLLFFQNVTFLLLSFSFVLLDRLTGKRNNKYNYVQLVNTTLFQLYFVTMPFGIVFIHLYNFYGMFAPVEKSTTHLIAQLIRLTVCILIEEVLFYYIHRILHTPWFYQRFHKLHHQIVVPVAVSTLYVDTVEHIVLNLLPVLFAPWLAGVQGDFLYVWFLLTNIASIASHSGYEFARFHEHHHRYRTCNYGVLGIMDKLHGTSTIITTS